MQYLTRRILAKSRYLLLIVGLISSLQVYASEGHPQWQKETEFGQPLFVISTHQRLSLDQRMIRVDIVVEVVNDMLMFIKDDNNFTASLDLHLSIIRSDEGRIVNQIKHVSRTVSEYKLTNSKRDYTTEVFTTLLEPDDYIVKVMLEDKESKRRESVEEKIHVSVRTSEERNAISDIILARSEEVDIETGMPLRPTVSGMIPHPSSPLFCHFDLMRNRIDDECSIKLTVIDKSGNTRFSDNSRIANNKILGHYYMPVSCEGLTFNRYDLVIEAIIASDTLRSTTSFTINFHGLPWVIRDIDQAIQYMRYIASSEEIERLAGEMTSRKEEAFLEFWDDNFPCQDDAINAKMVEYYSRINFANTNLSSNREGWETDRGRILIIYGKPSEIEKRTNSNNTVEYEIWHYNHLNRNFVFMDDFGFGEFRLTTPDW